MLRTARVNRGLEIVDAEQATKIRGRYLRALEEERFEILPGEAYTRGFLRTYAEFLRIDPEPLLEEYRRRVAHQAPAAGMAAPERVPPTPRRRGGTGPAVGGGAIAGIAVALVVVALFVIGLVGGNTSNEPAHRTATRAGEHHHQRHHHHKVKRAPARSTRVKVSLDPTATVWVCMVDETGRPVIDAATLSAGQRQGPFKGKSFDLNLGNGAVQLTVNGKRVAIASSPNPVGYHIAPAGTRSLRSGGRPTCS